MKIYVDFDDCLCETARSFTEIAARLFGKNVPYEEVRFFNLKESFDLNEDEYEQLMLEGHKPEILLAYEETPDASKVLNELMDEGHEVSVITGRPDSTYDVSRRWLDEHDLKRANLYFLNKYGRDTFYQKGSYNLELEDFYKMQFDYAIEDSPLAFKYFDKWPDLRVMVFDRPWNQECDLQENFLRCPSWEYIREQVRD
ncbi:5' nucleotidase, NT5C type [Pseudobutyrivibrio xylanivorans]|uniref:2-dehydropantoate 2-reductase n=1 Tax=Pseudobutyrivibrio xylanivorans TaxID=185007 RepID=A0A5P6VSP7_PSEXY|nr:2-dehydropantoate 2-reductase [Pseudobutyrivibrio xylanivorans]QFJ54224.1 2-dehydropantoate 2-reductase [Pseudobutyrivibrio xylanivorans]